VPGRVAAGAGCVRVFPRCAATYSGTGGTFLRTGGWAVLLDVRPGHPLVDLCWDQLGATSDPDDVLETIVAHGLRAVPAFAVVRETGARRLVARGGLALVLDGRDVLSDRPAGAWVDLSLTDVKAVEVSLTGAGQTGHSLPLRDGATAATGFHLLLEQDDTAQDQEDTAQDQEDTAQDQEAGHLFAETRTVQAVRQAGGSVVVGRAPTAAAAAVSDETLPTTFTAGLAPASGSRPERSDLGGSRRSLVQPGASVGVPRVLAAVCPAGHLTPAYSGVCRVCRQVVAAQEAFETTRPALGRLVLPQGDPLLLDRGAVLGRAPYVPAGWTGAQPHLVVLHDPDQDVSAQHVAVVLDLWNVLVCDLGSTNGTRLVDQAGRVTRLRPYEPVALGPGSAVVLADVVTLQFEVHP
jgi:FHA domain